jgi:hypothetical protein
VAGSMSLTFSGKGIVTRTSPFSTRFEKSLAFSPFTRKSSASTGRKSGSSAFGLCALSACSASNRALAAAGDSWKFSDGM